MTASKVVQFYFGPASRYSYLAAAQLEALAAETGHTLEWVPLDTPALFALRGRAPFQALGSGQYDGAYRTLDARRWAALYGLPFIEPQGRLPLDFTLLALACTAASRLGSASAYARLLMHEIFATTRTVLDAADCAALAPRVGLDSALLLAELAAPQTAQQHQQALRRAAAAGAFGVPTFVAGEALFWGNDRLPLLRHHLLTDSRRA